MVRFAVNPMHEDPLDLLLSYEQIAVQIRNI